MRTDTDRLDWLERTNASVERYLVFMGDWHWRVVIDQDEVIAEGETAREAIDAAMEAAA